MNKSKVFYYGMVGLLVTIQLNFQDVYAQSCKTIRPSKKYHAGLLLNSFTLCDDSGCQTDQSGGITEQNQQFTYYLRTNNTRSKSGQYAYYLLDRKTFREYQVTLNAGCGQVEVSLPISLNPGFADTDTVEMMCTGTVNKKNGKISGTCEGSFFALQLNGQPTFAGPFSLAPTNQVVINPCNTPEGILIYGTQCSNR